jgi:hypothetical protein
MRRLGVDRMRAAHHDRGRVLAGASHDGLDRRVDVGQQQVGGGAAL